MKLFPKQLFASTVKKLRTISPLHIACIILAITATIGIVKYYGKKGEWRTVKIQIIGRNWSNSYEQYQGYRPPYWLAEHINKGDYEVSLAGDKIAEIVHMESYSRGNSEYDLYATVNIYGVLNKRINTFVYNGKAIRVGDPIDLQLSHASVIGQIIDDNVSQEKYVSKQILTQVRISNVEPWAMNNIRVNEVIKDTSNDKILGKVISFRSEAPISSLAEIDQNGRLTLSTGTRLSDLVITVQLAAEKHNGELFVAGHQNVKIGNRLWLYLEHVNLPSGIIENVQVLQE